MFTQHYRTHGNPVDNPRQVRSRQGRPRSRFACALGAIAVASSLGGCSAENHDNTAARSSSIIGGQPATPNEWPWMARITDSSGGHWCGGTLIDPEWILTAAHCVSDPSITHDVVLGDHDIGIVEPTEQQIGVARRIIHPYYDSPSGDYDIALLRLATPAVLGNGVELISLGDTPADGTLATVTGWGLTSLGYANELMEVEIPIVDQATCENSLLPLTGRNVTSTMVCAGVAPPSTVQGGCYGDSGGPLVVSDGTSWTQVGIVSWGGYCNDYTVFARVDTFRDWIFTHLQRIPFWQQDATDRWLNPTPTVTGAQFAVTHNGVFFRGPDGYMERLFWNQATGKWDLDKLDAPGNRSTTGYRVRADSQVLVSASGIVFYVGENDRMQHFYRTGGVWLHDLTDRWLTPKPTVTSGNFAVTDRGIFFRGSAGYMERLFWNQVTGKWDLDALDAPGNRSAAGYRIRPDSQLLASATGSVFYVGENDRMQHFYLDAIDWRRDATDRWSSIKPEVTGRFAVTGCGVFFRGPEGYMERLYWNSDTGRWDFDVLDANSNRGAAINRVHPNSEILARDTCTVFYVGQNSRMQHFYRRN